MANLKDIRDRISSVKNTRKITEAMRLVAAAKVRRAQEQVLRSRPFADRLARVLENLQSRMQFETADAPLLESRDVSTITLLAVTGDRGGCVEGHRGDRGDGGRRLGDEGAQRHAVRDGLALRHRVAARPSARTERVRSGPDGGAQRAHQGVAERQRGLVVGAAALHVEGRVEAHDGAREPVGGGALLRRGRWVVGDGDPSQPGRGAEVVGHARAEAVRGACHLDGDRDADGGDGAREGHSAALSTASKATSRRRTAHEAGRSGTGRKGRAGIGPRPYWCVAA